MRAIVCQTPFWPIDFAPLNLAVLAAALEAVGMETETFDLNLRLNQRVPLALRSQWLAQTSWWDIDFVESVLAHAGPDLSTLAQRAHPGATIMVWTVASSSTLFTEQVLRILRSPQYDVRAPFAVGGPEIQLSGPGDWMHIADYVGIGEIEGLAAELRDITPGLAIQRSGCTVDLATMRTPAFGSLPISAYAHPERISYMAGRGCRNRCAYCSEGMLHRRLRYRPPELVGADLLQLWNTWPDPQYIRFQDSSINSSPASFQALLDVLDSLGYPWGANFCGDRCLSEPATCHRIVRAGCCFASVGLESASPRILAAMHKGTTVDVVTRMIRGLADAGVAVSVNFMAGFPGETEADHLASLRWIRSNRSYLHSLKISPTGTNLAHGSPLAKRPGRFGVRVLDPTKGAWEMADGSGGAPVRRQRARQLYEVAAAEGILVADPKNYGFCDSGPFLATLE
jgi:hypothetical protein